MVAGTGQVGAPRNQSQNRGNRPANANVRPTTPAAAQGVYGETDISEQHAPQVAPQQVVIPQNIGDLFVTTSVEQRLAVLLGLANAIIQEKGIGNKMVNIYTILKSMRDLFGNVPIELRTVEDCLDVMIYRGAVRNFKNPEAQTNNGQTFYGVSYGLSRAGWEIAENYNIQAPEWRVAGQEYDRNNYRPNGNTPYNGGRSTRNNNMNNNRVNNEVSI